MVENFLKGEHFFFSLACVRQTAAVRLTWENQSQGEKNLFRFMIPGILDHSRLARVSITEMSEKTMAEMPDMAGMLSS